MTKATLKINWWREMRKWLVNRGLEVGIADGKCFPSTPIVIINYDIAHKFEKRLTNREWDCVIVDEGHHCKNRLARRTKAVFGYKPGRDEPVSLLSTGIPAKYKLALSGTPIENNIEEMWPCLWWLDRDQFPSRHTLLKIAGGGHRPGGIVLAPTADGLAKLQELLRRTVMIRRLKSDVLKELPPKTRIVTELSPDGMEHLIKAEKDLWERQENDRIQAKAEAEIARAADDDEAYKRAIDKLREGQGWAFAEMARIRKETAWAKVPQTIELIHERLEQVGKIIVFAHHTACLEEFATEFGQMAVIVHGGHDNAKRDERVHRFMTDPTCRLFLGSIRATGEGLTLTSASYVMFHEHDWVPAKMEQCSDRAHRIGQKDNVTVELLVVDGTIDAQMAKTCVEKAALADKALDAQTKTKLLEEPVAVVTEREWKPLATARELANRATLVTRDQREAVGMALDQLSGRCDGARKIDGAGFNKMDSAIGKGLADLGALRMTDKQVVLGAKLVRRYQRQLNLDLVKRSMGLEGLKGNDENDS